MHSMKKTAALIILLIASPVLFFAAVNLSVFDEKLIAPVHALLNQQRNVQVEGNGYMLMYGLKVPADANMETTANQIMALLEKDSQNNLIAKESEILKQLLTQATWSQQLLSRYSTLFCEFKADNNCFEALLDQVSSNMQPPPELAGIKPRFDRLLATTAFAEPDFMTISTAFPEMDLVFKLGLIYLAEDLNQRNTIAFTGDALAQIRFWRIALVTSHTLLAKMVANAGIYQTAKFISFSLNNQAYQFNDEEKAALREGLSPLTEEEGNIAESFVEELRMAIASGLFDKNMSDAIASGYFGKNMSGSLFGVKLLTKIALQPNATVNDFYEHYTAQLIGLASLNGPEFLEAIDQGFTPYPEPDVFPPTVYNLAGKIVLSDVGFAAADYIGRMHDLDGLLRLVNIQILAQSQPLSEVLNIEDYRNPYTFEAMSYSEKNKTLGFACHMRPAEFCRVEIDINLAGGR